MANDQRANQQSQNSVGANQEHGHTTQKAQSGVSQNQLDALTEEVTEQGKQQAQAIASVQREGELL